MVKAHAFAPKRASKAKIQNSMILRENSNKPESPAHTLGEVTHRQAFCEQPECEKLLGPIQNSNCTIIWKNIFMGKKTDLP